MPLTSSQISQMNGSFQAQYMQNQSMAGMIQPPGYNLGGYNTGAQNEGMAGGMLNKGMGIGAPVAALGMGLMGLDPLSIGIRGGMAAHGMGLGVGGSMMAGAAMAAPMAAGVAGIGYMGHQMMSGAQQTQQFNQDMRSGYSFFNPHGQHGRGFSEGNIRQIGGNLRDFAGQGNAGASFGSIFSGMQQEVGPSFAELGRLASGMGRMGMADGVRNAKEFTDKFKEMMKTVKSIATDMGTSLEEAQKTMAAMKGSGVFKNQAGVTGAIRAASISGGLATTEVTGMMNIGSQISRMYGGTGRQGAMGGIKAIEQVGMAVQTGALSEEDIYNTTGLTGAEGRRAMAQQNLMQTGSFLKSSKGRWMMASMAGKNGQLDQGSVNDFLAGGMSVGDTRGAAHRNLKGVGRANFIRNEGRLRGSIMEEFGGMAPAMAMMGWAQGKGIDVNSMGDREMLFMQRQMGLGRDEADSMVKMAKALPDMLQHRRGAKQDDMFSREHGLRAQDSGIEGIKRKLDAAKDKVNNELQKVGQAVLGTMTDAVAEWGNKLAGTYEERAFEGIGELRKSLHGDGNRSAVHTLMSGKLGKLYGAGGGGDSFVHEDPTKARQRATMQDFQFSARMATVSGIDPAVAKMLANNSDSLSTAYGSAGGLAGMAGKDRVAGFEAKFGESTELGKHFRGLDARGKGMFLQQAELSMGMDKGLFSETLEIPGLPQLVGGGEDHSNPKSQERLGRALLGIKSTKESSQATAAQLSKTQSSMGGNPMMAGSGMGGAAGATIFGALFGGIADSLNGTKAKTQAAGAIFDTAETRELSFDVLTGAKGATGRLEKMRRGIMGGAAERGGMDKLTDSEKGTLGALSAIEVTSDLNKMIEAAGGDINKLSEKDWDKLIAKRKEAVVAAGGDADSVDKDHIKELAKGTDNAANKARNELVETLAKQVGRSSKGEMEALKAGGVLPLTGEGGLTDSAKKQLKAGGAGALSSVEGAVKLQEIGMRIGAATNPDEQASLMKEYEAQSAKVHGGMRGLDSKALRAIGSTMAGTDEGDMATSMVMRGNAMQAGVNKKGAFGAVADQLGVRLDKDQLAAMKGKGPKAQAAMLARELGVTGDEKFLSGLEESIATVSKKGGAISGADKLSFAKSGASEATKDKLKEYAKERQGPQEKMIDLLKESNTSLKTIADGVKPQKAAVDNLASLLYSKDGEK